MLGFGSGPHCCVGEQVMWDVMIHVSKEMVRRYTWDLPNHTTTSSETSENNSLAAMFPELDMKYLPVSRPRTLEPILIRERNC